MNVVYFTFFAVETCLHLILAAFRIRGHAERHVFPNSPKQRRGGRVVACGRRCRDGPGRKCCRSLAKILGPACGYNLAELPGVEAEGGPGASSGVLRIAWWRRREEGAPRWAASSRREEAGGALARQQQQQGVRNSVTVSNEPPLVSHLKNLPTDRIFKSQAGGRGCCTPPSKLQLNHTLSRLGNRVLAYKIANFKTPSKSNPGHGAGNTAVQYHLTQS
ncbi:hypothetical protein E2C01_057652 [Portunus trituberculatus]|uniref:Uncharacterized protein n=1 Tax=Portunus trituberculatus TaxID=210409 RepID=A0A5B7H0L2_PORTR|nr:hypothetical protein [Portunus trituberculatus]